ncbi:MAG: hypothetical protein H6Q58_2251 [Firmicutes bacterium]|nr:hypothetical protein [Bacillota bacterium]
MQNTALREEMRSMRKKLMIISAAVLLVLAAALGGCSGKDAAVSNTSNGSGDSSDTAYQRNSACLTSEEAASLAYLEAKAWDPDAVLWYMQAFQYRLHYDWINSDKSSGWLVAFANPDNANLCYITIYNKKVADITEMNTRYGEIKNSYSKAAPGITMKEAIQAAVSNGAPEDLMPYSVEYRMDGEKDPGTGEYRPMWTFAYRFQITDDTYDLHFYYVDGLTGEFVKMNVKNESGKILDSSAARVKSADYDKYLEQQDNRHLILKYFTLIDEGKYSDALDMMDENLVPDSAAEKSWTDGWKSIDQISIDWTYKYYEEEWTADTQTFEVNLNVKPSPDSVDSNWAVGENTRFITLKKTAGGWIIHEIATGP